MVSSGLIIGIVIGGIVLAVALFCFNNATRQVSIDKEVERIVSVVGVNQEAAKIGCGWLIFLGNMGLPVRLKFYSFLHSNKYYWIIKD